ncbi:hypothetical protein IVB45_05190 [Bradyrhizobium sp. 4]|uniref:hypothetical protein n=1 Tax=unclassified Bradyrhizobium TaxID=2631580 RepID=UPI001FF9846B|nr:MULTISPECIES: hypothetical protein [unclassified Bradyrhizobium]MCK1396983.1 hypothetical protein [Bradyrhizobium sp. 39]MCK1520110.1 hypothetical protein [Bradyrhizobium sp. 17]MCK1632617.1 hypothetical protein [Bradyrhizobium sp. 162]MCK1752259.1 hypothetical protein [Bradyrhizobium sp. 135]UPJ36359.1 hypothetical protein IVB45_05190 [Bradyrhizobium sp. 4]
MKIPLRTQPDLFAIAVPPAELSDEERLKAIALLRCRLVEAIITPTAGQPVQSLAEVRDEQDQR